MDIHKQKAAVATLSVISNSVLVVLKIVIGLIIGSVSVISEAIHSGVDLLAAIIALVAVKTAGQPADKEHPFGHGKVENVSGTVEALLIFLAAAWIIVEAIKKLLNPHQLEAAGWGIGVMLFSALANIVVSNKLFKVGKQTDSVALQADAWHLRTDVYTSIGVMAGLTFIWLGRMLMPSVNLNWVDPAAAILVALLIIKAAYKLTIESARDLLDISLPSEEEAWIHNYISSRNPTVKGFHHLRTRKAGSDRFVEFHLMVSSNMSVEESHRIGDEITGDIKNQLPRVTVTIHIEPCGGDCTSSCLSGCLLGQNERAEINNCK